MYVTLSGQRARVPAPRTLRPRGRPGHRSSVRCASPDGSLYPEAGKIDFIDVTVDQATDTVLRPAPPSPNPNATLIDGQLMTVLAGGRHARRGAGRAAVGADRRPGRGLCLRRRGRQGGGAADQAGGTSVRRLVAEGLTAGEQVIVEGIERVRPGAAVMASPVAASSDRTERCSPPSSSTARALPSSSRIVTVVAGLLSMRAIPIAQYPDIVPPQVSVTAFYPGASARGGRGYGRAAAGEPDRRRRQVDLHEERQRRRRQLPADRVLRARHRPRHQRRQRQQPRADGALQAPRGRARGGVTVKKRSSALLGVIALSSPKGTHRPALHLQLRHHQPDRRDPQHARRRRRRALGPRRTTRCGSGSTPTG